MSALDKAVAELDAKRAKDDAERRARQQAATAFLKEFFDADLAPSKSLKDQRRAGGVRRQAHPADRSRKRACTRKE